MSTNKFECLYLSAVYSLRVEITIMFYCFNFNLEAKLQPVTGEVILTTIYIRLSEGLIINIYNGILTANSTGVTTQNININGEVTAPIANCSELFFSEYHEGNGGAQERYLEMYNPTNSVVDLSNYRIANYRNGSFIPATVNLSGTVNPYSTFLIARDVSSLGLSGEADFISNSVAINFTGNDAIALQTVSGTNIDVIGVIGDNTNFAANTVLRRNTDVQIPTVTYNSSQWSASPVNNTDNFGIHDSECLCPDSTIWDGTSWSSGIPNSTTAAIINGNYNTSSETSFTSCSLTIVEGFTLTIDNGDFVEVQKIVL